MCLCWCGDGCACVGVVVYVLLSVCGVYVFVLVCRVHVFVSVPGCMGGRQVEGKHSLVWTGMDGWSKENTVGCGRVWMDARADGCGCTDQHAAVFH